jgi:hypothetical protein
MAASTPAGIPAQVDEVVRLSRRARRTFVCGWAALSIAALPQHGVTQVTSRSTDVGSFNVRAHSGLPAPAMRFLIANGSPSQVELNGGARLEDALTVKCGHYRNVYEPELRRLNAGLVDEALTAKTTGIFRLPACAHFQQDAKIRIVSEVSVGDFLQRETGFRGPLTLAAFLARNPQLGGLTLNSALPVGAEVHLDYRSEWTAITLKPESLLTAKQAQTRLGQLVAAARNSSEPSAVTVNSAVGATLSQVDPDGRWKCSADPNSSPWPYDVAQLSAALNRAKEVTTARGGTVREARVAVLDSAFPTPPAGPFTWDRLATPDGPPGRPGHYGFNADTRSDPPLSIGGIEDADHGTLVSTIAIGGPEFLKAGDPGAAKVRLRLYSIVELGGVDRNGLRTTQVREDDVVFAINDATQKHDTYIVNASFEFPLEPATIVPLVQRESKLLLVSAAGNRPEDIDIIPRWPASFGGSDGPIARQVLTVGASDAARRLAAFSSSSAKKVDLLAPGCRVPSFARDLSPQPATGTSFAAPIATFTAALVRQFGVTDGARLKERLVIATDVRWGLYHEAWAAGILNPLKALELFSDYVEQDGVAGPLRGTLEWTSTGNWQCLGSTDLPTRGRVLKVARLDRPQTKSLWLVIWRTRANDLRRCQVDLRNEFISLIEPDGFERTLPFSAVRDLISAHDF